MSFFNIVMIIIFLGDNIIISPTNFEIPSIDSQGNIKFLSYVKDVLPIEFSEIYLEAIYM